MTDVEKIAAIKAILLDGGSLPSDEKLTVYLTLAKNKILHWRYSLVGGVPMDVINVPAQFEETQIYAVIAGYTHAGAEGETQHNENGINRVFSSTDMNNYIERNVMPYSRVGAVSTT